MACESLFSKTSVKDCCQTELELISKRKSASFCRRTWLSFHKGSCVAFVICHSWSMHSCIDVSVCMSLLCTSLSTKPKPIGSRSKLQWSSLQCECTCCRLVHLTACQTPDAGYQRVCELTVCLLWALCRQNVEQDTFVFEKEREQKKTCCYWCLYVSGFGVFQVGSLKVIGWFIF